MKKSLLLLSSLFILSGTNLVVAEEDNSARIAEIESQIKALQVELKELKGTSNQEQTVIADDESFYIEFKEIKEKEDSFMGNSYEVIFEVENKTDMNVEVQARTVSVDGMMVDDAILSMSQEVAPGKKAKAVLTFQDYSGDTELPELIGDLEMDLHIFSWDDYDYNVDYPVIINLK